MKIAAIQARWLQAPVAPGTTARAETALVRVETACGVVGWGDAKAAVGRNGGCAQVVSCINRDLGPDIIGRDPREMVRLWDEAYSGRRAEHALATGIPFPRLSRRGLTIAALGAIDTALWDIAGKAAGAPIVDLLGGAVHDLLPAYAAGLGASAADIGAAALGAIASGFSAVKLRAGRFAESLDASIERTIAARDAIGPDAGLMVDAHGSWSADEAVQFCHAVASCQLSWLEEPCSADDVAGTVRVRRETAVPVATGEVESTRFAFRDLIERGAADVLQPDIAVVGGITEAQRVAALCEANNIALSPHVWGAAPSFAAAVHVAFASKVTRVLEYAELPNPMLHELVRESLGPVDGVYAAPTAPGLGITIDEAFVDAHTID